MPDDSAAGSQQEEQGILMARDAASGRFLPGNRYGGNPAAGRITALRAEVLQSIDPREIRVALAALYQMGVEDHNVSALVAWLGYVLGRPREGGLISEAMAADEQSGEMRGRDLLLLSDAELMRMIATAYPQRGDPA